MSKSLGNVISPLDVAERARGAEILRLWVSMIDFLEDMRLSQETPRPQRREPTGRSATRSAICSENLAGFDPAADAVPQAELLEIDRWALHQLESLRALVVNAYEGHPVPPRLSRAQRVRDGDPVLVLPGRSQGPAVHLAPAPRSQRRSAQTVLWADGVRGRTLGGADPLLHGGGDLAGARGAYRKAALGSLVGARAGPSPSHRIFPPTPTCWRAGTASRRSARSS